MILGATLEVNSHERAASRLEFSTPWGLYLSRFDFATELLSQHHPEDREGKLRFDMSARAMFFNTPTRFPEVAVRHLRFRPAQSLGKGHQMPQSRSSLFAERTTPFTLNSLDQAGASFSLNMRKSCPSGAVS